MKVNLMLFLHSKKLGKPFLVKFSAHENRFFVIFSGRPCMYEDNLGGQENITFVQRKKKKLWKRKDNENTSLGICNNYFCLSM